MTIHKIITTRIGVFVCVRRDFFYQQHGFTGGSTTYSYPGFNNITAIFYFQVKEVL